MTDDSGEVYPEALDEPVTRGELIRAMTATHQALLAQVALFDRSLVPGTKGYADAIAEALDSTGSIISLMKEFFGDWTGHDRPAH